MRYGGLAPRQLGAASVHCKLEPLVANFMKTLCSQEIYRHVIRNIIATVCSPYDGLKLVCFFKKILLLGVGMLLWKWVMMHRTFPSGC